MNFFYIIYSKKVDQYYTGETKDVLERLGQHNTGFFKSSSTKKSDDWELLLHIECIDRSQARRLEAFVKRQKSRIFIESLINDPEKRDIIIKKLRNNEI